MDYEEDPLTPFISEEGDEGITPPGEDPKEEEEEEEEEEL